MYPTIFGNAYDEVIYFEAVEFTANTEMSNGTLSLHQIKTLDFQISKAYLSEKVT